MQQFEPPRPQPTLADLILLGALTAFGAVSIDLYLPGLPSIGATLGANPAAVQQTMAAFFIGMALGQLFYGPLSDRYGRRPMLLTGVAIYVVASLGCALAPTIGMLVAGRFVQALGCCAGVVVARAVVRDRYATQDSARIFSLLTLVLGVAPMIAPTIGGWLVAVASWRVIFFMLAGFGFVVGVAVLRALPESRSPATAAKAHSESIAAAYLDLLRQPRLVGYMLAGALNGAALFTYVSGAPELVISSFGFGMRAFGWLFAALAVGVIGASQINRWLLNHYKADSILAVASLISLVAGGVLLGVAVTGAGGRWAVLAALFAVLTSYGFMAANTLAGALSIDPLRAGSTSALVGSASFAAGALASSLAAAFHDGTAVPMAVVMAGAMAGAAALLFGLALPKGLLRR